MTFARNETWELQAEWTETGSLRERARDVEVVIKVLREHPEELGIAAARQ